MEDISELLAGIGRRLAGEGAAAVVLVGSHARGHAHAGSDIDIYAVGEGSEYRLSVEGGKLVSVSWRVQEAVRRSFRDPVAAVQAVPAWRAAVPLQDPGAIAATLTAEATAWGWELLGDGPDVWAAEALAGYAEEVLKLVAALERREAWLAAVQRDVLALHMAGLMAVRLHLLCHTENELWAQVADVMGPAWRVAQAAALAVGGESLGDSARASLTLFRLAATNLADQLDARQRAVVDFALEAIESRAVLEG